MKLWLRLSLLWLLAAALPVQGWAAATMAWCGPAHHLTAQPMAAQQGHAAHHHGGDDVAAAAGGHEHGTHHDTSAHGKAKCSACASCCMGTALPTSVSTFAAAAQTFFISPVLPRTSVSFLTAGPERPPRTLRS